MEGKHLQQEATAPKGEERPNPFLSEEAAPAKSASTADAAGAAGASALPPEEDERLRADVVAALKTVYDPEIPADIYELGLIYDIAIDAERNVAIAMTLTAPACPVAGEMPQWVENAVNAVPGVAATKVTMTFDPPWDMSRMSDEARLALNMF
jgi:FeS assembly SUF system protein